MRKSMNKEHPFECDANSCISTWKGKKIKDKRIYQILRFKKQFSARYLILNMASTL